MESLDHLCSEEIHQVKKDVKKNTTHQILFLFVSLSPFGLVSDLNIDSVVQSCILKARHS